MAQAVPNLAPEFNSVPNLFASAGQNYSYQAEAVDSDGDRISYLLYSAPPGMSIDSETGLLSWTPTVDTPAQTEVILRAYDSSGAYDTQSFSIEVLGGNRAPQWQSLPAEILGREGESLQVQVNAIDPEDRNLIYWINQLPPGANFDPDSQTLNWTPGDQEAGTYEIIFTVSDGVNKVDLATKILIAPTDRAPQLQPLNNLTVQEGELVRLQLAASDPEGDELTYSSSFLPGGAILNPNTGLFQWTPDFFQAGEYEIPFQVSDGTRTETKSLQLTVLNANGLPEFDPLGSWQVPEGQEIRFRAFAFDPDNPGFIPQSRISDNQLTPLEGTLPTVSYSATGLPEGATFDVDTAEFSWTPDSESAGEYLFTFTATDEGDGTGNPGETSIEVPIIVSNRNRAPEIVPIENQNLQRGEVLELQLEANDPDGDPIEFAIANESLGFALPDFITFTDNGNGTASLLLEPGFNDRGDYTLTLTATDNGGGDEDNVLSDTYSFVVSVNSPNEPPVLDYIGDQVAVVGDLLELPIFVSDLDQDELTYSLTGLAIGATITPGDKYGEAILTWTPLAEDIGSYTVSIEVSDSGNGNSDDVLQDSQDFTIEVRNSNNAPVLPPLEPLTVNEGETLTLQLNATDSDNDALTYLAENLPEGSNLDPATGLFTWTPNFIAAGLYEDIQITVTDGHSSSTQPLSITVENTNQAPVFSPLPLQSGREDTALRFTLNASDFDGDSLIISPVSVSALPEGAIFEGEQGNFEWIPSYEQAGEYDLNFKVIDPQGEQGETTVTVRIDNVNRSPNLDADNHEVALGETLTFTLIGDDPDLNSTLSYSAVGLPEDATLDSATGEFSWTPNPGQLGDYPITFTVSDGNAEVSKTVLVRAVLRPEPLPVNIELTPSFPAIPNQPVLIHAIADSLGDIVSVDLVVDGEPLEIDEKGRGQFIPETPGLYEVIATATDTDGRVGQIQKIIRVRDPEDILAPVVGFDPGLNGSQISNSQEIIGTVADTNLEQWQLQLIALGSSEFVTLATGDRAIDNSELLELDPSTLRNGIYQLQLTATDISGRTSKTEALIEINTDIKTNQYIQQETDLTVSLGGTSLDLIRTYDVLNRDALGSFGYGWRLADPQIQTNAIATGQENLGIYTPFESGTRLFLTLPEGNRVGFTFQPKPQQEVQGLTYYTPAWVADAGVDYTLESVSTLLTKTGDRFYDLKTGNPYNPASGFSGQLEYQLTAADGTVYELSTAKGLLAQVTADGVRLTYSDGGIISDSGEAVIFERDDSNRLTKIIAPDGREVRYSYDEQGNLVTVRDLATGTATRYGYDSAIAHQLTLVAGEEGTVIDYGTNTPQTTPIVADLGTAHRFSSEVTQGNLVASQSDYYTFSVRESELRGTATEIVFIGVEIQANQGSSLQTEIPAIAGLTPLETKIEEDKAFALYAVEGEGINLIEVRGINDSAGEYSLKLTVAGDVNRDGLVNGVDSQLVQAALGKAQGDEGSSLDLDVSRDGVMVHR